MLYRALCLANLFDVRATTMHALTLHNSFFNTKQEYKCHKSNGVVFCFYENRVFASCMDQECRRALSFNMKSYYIMAKELEDEIFSTGNIHANNTEQESSVIQNSSSHAQSILSRSQLDFLDSVRKRKHNLVHAYQQTAASSQHASPLERLHLREFCKVPWR